MVKKYSILIVILALFGSPAYAQVQGGDITLSFSPQYPSPNQNVTATLGSHSTNLDLAFISWSINTTERSNGVGKKTFSFTTDNLGSALNISATINTVDGQSIEKKFTISATDVDLLWEAADSYAPPFYKGKTLAGSQGAFKVVAMPNIINQSGKVNANNLSYVWTKDGNVQSDSSGWGKNSLVFTNSYLDKGNVVTVKVSDITRGANASGTINLAPSSPKIVFYAFDPSLGVKWDRAISNGFKVNPDGEILFAEPYYFSPNNISLSNLVFDWSINNSPISTPSPKNILSVKPEAGQSGSAIIKIMVNNAKTLFQSAEKEVSVEF